MRRGGTALKNKGTCEKVGRATRQKRLSTQKVKRKPGDVGWCNGKGLGKKPTTYNDETSRESEMVQTGKYLRKSGRNQDDKGWGDEVIS
jgi:hypothetical protein